MTGKDAVKKLHRAGLYARLRRNGRNHQLFVAIGAQEISLPTLPGNTNARDEGLSLPDDVRRLSRVNGKPLLIFSEVATITEDPGGWQFSGSVDQLGLEMLFSSFAVQAAEDWFQETPEFGDRTMSLEEAIQRLGSRGFEATTNYRGFIIGGIGPRGEISRSQHSYGIIRHGSFWVVVLPGEAIYRSETLGVRWLAQAVEKVFTYYHDASSYINEDR